MRVSEIHFKRIRVNQGLGVLVSLKKIMILICSLLGIKQKSYEKRNPRQAFSRKSLIFFVDSSSTGSISSALECGMISSYISLELKYTTYKYLQEGIILLNAIDIYVSFTYSF